MSSRGCRCKRESHHISTSHQVDGCGARQVLYRVDDDVDTPLSLCWLFDWWVGRLLVQWMVLTGDHGTHGCWSPNDTVSCGAHRCTHALTSQQPLAMWSVTVAASHDFALPACGRDEARVDAASCCLAQIYRTYTPGMEDPSIHSSIHPIPTPFSIQQPK